jgi:hypothetical protein
MTTTKLVNVKTYAGAFGHSCMHCNVSARVTAERVTRSNGRKMRMLVRYCPEHFEMAQQRWAQT